MKRIFIVSTVLIFLLLLRFLFYIIFPVKLENNWFSNVLSIAYFIRQRIIEAYQDSLSPDLANLLIGIVLGVKEPFSNEFQTALKSTGLTHVIAASGMNVTMVAGFIAAIANRLFRRQFATSLVMIGILVYAIISGLSPSILRATIMILFVFSASLFGRQYSQVYGLILAGFIMLFIDPSTLFDIGFQLSFLSTLGILFIKPLLNFKNIFSDDLATTGAAQIATLPILLINFSQYGILSILVNSLVLWTIPPLMIIGSISAVISLIFIPLARIIVYLALPFLVYFSVVVSWFGSLGLSANFKVTPVFILGYYLVVVAILQFINSAKKNHRDNIN